MMVILDEMFDEGDYGVNIGDTESDRSNLDELIAEDFMGLDGAYIWVSPFRMTSDMTDEDVQEFLEAEDRHEALKKIFLRELKKELEAQ